VFTQEVYFTLYSFSETSLDKNNFPIEMPTNPKAEKITKVNGT